MSLFPAYSHNSKGLNFEDNKPTEKPKVRETGELPWLQNLNTTDEQSVVDHDTLQQATTSDVSAEQAEDRSSERIETTSRSKRKHEFEGVVTDSKRKHSKKKKKKHKSTRDISPDVSLHNEEDFYEDKSCCRGFLKIETISRPAAPVYRSIFFKVLGDVNSILWKKRRKKNYRYYTFSFEKEEKRIGTGAETSTMAKEETEIRQKTEEYNSILSREPCNVDMWVQYVDYQETVLQFEKTHHGVHGRGTTAERQLSIIDRGLSHNPGNKQLIQKRLVIAESSLPADVASRQIEILLTLQPSSIELWRGFVRTTQYSMALCSAPGVLKLYMRATQQLHQSRRGVPASITVIAESSILDLLLDCGFFLRQAGLWEHLWVLVQAYLTLNLDTPSVEYFDVEPEISEDEIMAEEMKVVRSQLPLMTIWTRVERIREDTNWVPLSSDDNNEDPQRQIKAELAELVHPVTSASINFRLITICITLLKVPLLPYHHCWSMMLGVDQVPWAVDGPEWLLPVLQPPSPMWPRPPHELLRSVLPLVGGPQYLHSTLGQPVFFRALCTTMRLVSDVLPEPFATSILVWWLRFERLLLILDRIGLCKSPVSHRKIRTSVKDILKQERYRNNLSLYHEFALLELDTGRPEAAERVLSSTAEATFPGIPVAAVKDSGIRAALIAIYRSLCEVRLLSGDRAGAITALVSLATGYSGNTSTLIAEAVAKYAHIGTELLREAAEGEADGSEFLLADTTVDWLTCHAWLLFLTDSPWIGITVLEKHVTSGVVPTRPITKEMCRTERLWESYICVLQWHCIKSNTTFCVLHKALLKALKIFPNNLNFLACLSNIQNISSTVSITWCQLMSCFKNSEAVLAQVFLLLDCIYKSNKVHEANKEAHKYLQMGGPILIDPSEDNRYSAMLDRLLQNHTTKRCPLLWRLKLSISPSENIFYQAIDECPWVRDLYLDGTLCVPSKADKLQTMLMEKELRYHVLPDELDVIRSGLEALNDLKPTSQVTSHNI